MNKYYTDRDLEQTKTFSWPVSSDPETRISDDEERLRSSRNIITARRTEIARLYRNRPAPSCNEETFFNRLVPLLNNTLVNSSRIQNNINQHLRQTDSRLRLHSLLNQYRGRLADIILRQREIAEAKAELLLRPSSQPTTFKVQDINNILAPLPFGFQCTGIYKYRSSTVLECYIGPHRMRPPSNYMRGARGNFSEKELKDFYTKGVPRQGFKFVIKFNSGSFENIAVPYSLLIENPESFKNFRGSGGSSTEVVAFDGNMATLAPHERTLKFHPHFNHGMIDGRHTEEYRILPHNNIADGCLGGYLNLLQKGVIDKSFIAIGLACIGFFTTFNNSDSWGESGVSIYTPEDLYVSEFAEGAVIETVVPLDTTGIQVDPWSPIVYYDFKDKKIKLILEAPEYVKFHLTIRWRGDTVELENQTLEDLAVLNINPYDLISFTINPNLGESTTINVEGMS